MPDQWSIFMIGAGLTLAFGYAFVSVLYRGLNRKHTCETPLTNEPVYLLAALAILDKGLETGKPVQLLELRERIMQGIDSYAIVDFGFKYHVGDRVRKTDGEYSYNGWVTAAFRKRGPTGKQDGPVRYVVEDSRGLLVIMSDPELNTGAGN